MNKLQEQKKTGRMFSTVLVASRGYECKIGDSALNSLARLNTAAYCNYFSSTFQSFNFAFQVS